MIEIWTVYNNPKDYPGKAVARLFIGQNPTNIVIVKNELNEVRAVMLAMGHTCLERMKEDDPCIVETWL
jgi:hypothetical protein